MNNIDNIKQYSENNVPPYPVTKVNNRTGNITLDFFDVGAIENIDKEDYQIGMQSNGTNILASINGGISRTLLDTILVQDYIIENNSSDDWTYRKWNSGIIEAWFEPASNSTYSLTSASQYGFYVTKTLNIPTTLSTALKSISSIFASTMGNTGLTTVNIAGLKTVMNQKIISYRPYCTTSMEWTGKIFFYLRGKWKN